MRSTLVILATLAAASFAHRASAWDCVPVAGEVPRRVVVERITPTLLLGWTFDRSPSGFIGAELAYSHQDRATLGGYAQALILSDPDAGGRRGQLGVGALAAPWKAPSLGSCETVPFVDLRPLARLGYAWRAANLEADATSFVQAGFSASAVLGVVFAFALPLTGGRSHGMQPSFALTLSLPLVVGGAR
ncbi:MAG: hypothetical protein HYV09_32455 [Deltaproteobacteria bacterium]|nr:hypothetical protein [Deltaproteobacteria bacterium]